MVDVLIPAIHLLKADGHDATPQPEEELCIKQCSNGSKLLHKIAFFFLKKRLQPYDYSLAHSKFKQFVNDENEELKES